MPTARPRVLIVDDEPAVLEAFRLSQGRRYEVSIAETGADALNLLRDQPGIAVIVSDLRMPGMDGAELLQRVREAFPDVVRMLLTGNADLEAAARAVNEGGIFRLLLKPCPAEIAGEALAAAIEIHRLMAAERVLLQKTLVGAVQAVTNVLVLTNPMALGRAVRVRERARQVADLTGNEDRWQLEFAAICSQLAAASLPTDIIGKLYSGRPLSTEEFDALADNLRAITQALADIPRLEVVAELLDELAVLVRGHRGTEPVAARISPNARLLHAIIDLESLEARGQSFPQAIAQLQSRSAVYGEEALAAVSVLSLGDEKYGITTCTPDTLKDGMVLAEDLLTSDGLLLLPRGFELSQSSREHIVNRFRHALPSTVRVRLDSGSAVNASCVDGQSASTADA